MARNRYIKTHSNYVIKDIHQSTNIGNIYERDFMTISELNSYAPGSLPAYGLNGFKMVVNGGINLKKKHHYGNWLKNEACDSKTPYWSLLCMDETDVDNSPNKAVLKPNLNSLLDFACYGSAEKMVESAVKNIINTYPGELYLTDIKKVIGDRVFYLVDNPFNIEMDEYPLNDDEIDNIMRVFSKSYENYYFIDEGGAVGNLTWELKNVSYNVCRYEGEELSMIDLGHPYGVDKPAVLLFYYVFEGKKILFHDGSYLNAQITPKNNMRKKFFNDLTDFEKVLLNKKTNYSVILETPKETPEGNVLYRKSYIWPKTHFGNWNIDVSSNNFLTYFDSLLSIGEFYDKYYSNNIWRAMTHEAIINFDWTLTKMDSEGVIGEYDSPNSERIKSFIHVAGRQFDELKQYIDGIANSNCVTYDECGNKPDCFLVDELVNYGWDVKAPLSKALSKFTSYALYPGHVDGFTVQDANYEFYRRLLLNSRAVLSAKGTKRSIEMIMSLFGYYSLNFIENSYHEAKRDGKIRTLKWEDLEFNEQKEILRYSYDMTEYVYVAGSGSTLWRGIDNDQTALVKIEDVKEKNKYKINYDFLNSDEYQGLPVREVMVSTRDYPVYYYDENGDEYIHHYIADYRNYLIPWFDRNMVYDADIYFESKGGWGLRQTMIGQFDDYNDVVIDTTKELKIYDESIKYLRFVNTIEDLLTAYGEYPKKNEVYYVYDISGFRKYEWGYLTKKDENGKLIPEPAHTMSHYFVLKDIEHSDVLGAILDGENGLPKLESEKFYYSEDGIILGEDNDSIDELGFPIKQYGWKNVSEDELNRGVSEDAKRVYYMESIVENNGGNAPHGGFGKYDDGNTYKDFFKDIFKGARDEDAFIDTTDNAMPKENEFGFELEKEIDNVKCWYFSDTINDNHSLEMISKSYDEFGREIYTGYGYQETSVGDGNFVRVTDTRDSEGDANAKDELFSSRQYSFMEPYNMEKGGSPDDEAAANSIINSKHFYIEFVPDMSSPGGMYDFIENSVMYYAKQVIPSTTILKYYVPMRDMDVNCYHRTYIQSAIITE